MNQNIVDYKYKERDPSKTVEIIKKFFSDRGFNLKIEKDVVSDSGTYGCHLRLYYKGDFIMFSNGKGASRELSYASGYAEMYERFCNGMKIYVQKNIYRKFKEVSMEKYGYHIHPDEKIMSYEEIISDKNTNDWFNVVCNNNEKVKEKIIRYIANNEFIGFPYKNLLTNEKKYIDPQIMLRIQSSTGMCAGNTFEEAFNEGFSEILERYTYIDLINSIGLESYKAINIDKLENEALKECAKNIKELGYDFYLVDLSYDYGTPVVMGLFVDKQNYLTRINFGSFPVFEVAAMRTITEGFQNVKRYTREDDLFQEPSDKNFVSSIFFDKNGTGLSEAAYMPPNFFKNVEFVDTYNKEMYLDVNATPQDVYNYYLSFISNNKLNVWYIENGLIPELASLQIYVDNLAYYYPLYGFVDYEKMDYNKLLKRLALSAKYEFMIYDDKKDFSKINYKDSDILDFVDPEDDIFQFITYSNDTYPLPVSFWLMLAILQDYDNYDNGRLARKYAHTFIFPYIKKYFTILRYANQGYTFDEMKDIIYNLGIVDFTKEDFNKINDQNYLLEKILIEPCWEYYRSDKYYNFIETLIDRK